MEIVQSPPWWRADQATMSSTSTFRRTYVGNIPLTCKAWLYSESVSKRTWQKLLDSGICKKKKRKLVQLIFTLHTVLMCSVMANSLRPHGLQPTRLLCPWNFPGTNTGVGCHFLLQVIFWTQGSNPHLLSLLHWQADSLPLSHLGSLTWGRSPWKSSYQALNVRFQSGPLLTVELF